MAGENESNNEKPGQVDADLQRLRAAATIETVAPEVEKAQQQEILSFEDGAAEWAGLLYGLAVPSVEAFAPNWKEPLTTEGSKEECDKLKTWAKACGPVLQKYFPDGANKSPEATAIIVTAMTFVPLMHIPRHAPKEKA